MEKVIIKTITYQCLFVILFTFSVFAEEHDSNTINDSIFIDTLVTDSIRDSQFNPDDTLTEAQRLLKNFEDQYRKRQAEKLEKLESNFSFFDTLTTYFLSERLDQRNAIERSFAFNPGDYFKFDPSYYVSRHEITPMRRTVKPFALSGNRTNLVYNGIQRKPFEHIPEPDGLIDLNDLPTALDHNVYLLSGSIGQLFGGDQAIATLYTSPKKPDGNETESAFIVDKGSFQYSYAKGKFSKRFVNGREIDMSIGYKKADGLYINHFEDSYQYFGDFYFPLSRFNNYGTRFVGALYDREGRLAVRPNNGSVSSLQARDRFDRHIRWSLLRQSENRTNRSEIGFTHDRQGSYLTQVLRGNLDIRSFGGFFSHEFGKNNKLFKFDIKSDWLEQKFSQFETKHTRYTASIAGTVLLLNGNDRYAIQGKQKWVENYRFLPSATFAYLHDGDKFMSLLSIGYAEREPSLYELFLPEQTANVYNLSVPVYSEIGYSDLKTEKQLVASSDIEIGNVSNSLGFKFVGGKIFDGIDWNRFVTSSTVQFAPRNDDIEFFTATGKYKFKLLDYIRLNTGVSYHHVKHEDFPERAYTPEFQAFGGLELHIFWRQKLTHLYGYIEGVYVGKYDGYDNEDIGNTLIGNAKLSFRMGSFRFHYIFQNITNLIYQEREDFQFLGRYNSWGFTWDFLD